LEISSELAVRENIIAACSQKLKQESTTYRTAQEEYKLAIQRKIKRQLHVIDPSLTEETIQDIMDNGEGTESFFKHRIMTKKVNSEIQTTCYKAKTKFKDVLALEQSMTELHRMFLDLTLLIEIQGKHLDEIKLHVDETVDHVEAGNQKMNDAIHIQKSIRNKQGWLILIVAVVIGVIAITVIL